MEIKTIIDDKTKVNIELGAGCGEFGFKYLTHCYITEYDLWYEKNCEQHYVDFFEIDAKNLYFWKENRFKHIIMCNPFDYGFNGIEQSEELLRELCRVLEKEGKITVIATETNKWGAYEKIKSILRKIKFENVEFKLDEKNDLDIKYRSHNFMQRFLNQKISSTLYQSTIYVSKY